MIDATHAKRIASHYMTPNNAYSVYAHTGRVTDDLATEILADIAEPADDWTASDVTDLQALLAYVRAQEVDVWVVGHNVSGYLPDDQPMATVEYAAAVVAYADNLGNAGELYCGECACEPDADELCDACSTEACGNAMQEDVPSPYSYATPREISHYINTDTRGRIEFFLSRERMTYGAFLDGRMSA